ncbi:Aluminum-activated malate transporter [Sesbania bispinosa]|nr:Aluminum-activated malate transporter [Sesbania bispinosa]
MASEANRNSVTKGWQHLMAFPSKFSAKVVELMLQLKKLGKEDPRRVTHSLKVALSITLVSAFYYLKPLYNGFGSSAMWAVFTVVVVSEFSVGKSNAWKRFKQRFSNIFGWCFGGWIILLGLFNFKRRYSGTYTYWNTAVATYVRFLPQMKARYDYGLLVFILTFSLVSVSSYRDREIFDIAQKRLTTILAGALISVLVCILVCPVWAGGDLHNLVSKNIEKLGNFLQGFGDEYFGTSKVEESNKSIMQGYKSVLNSKQAEDSLANFARWEPCHGRFKFRHPWQQYQKIGNLSRQCAYRIDALNGFLNSSKTPSAIRRKIQEPCITMSKETGMALKELAVAIQKMIPPSAADPHIAKSKIAATNLRSMIKTGLWEDTNLFEVVPVVTVASLLLDVVSCTERLAESIQELSTLAKFKNKDSKVLAETPVSPNQEEAPQTCHCDNSVPQHVITINQPSAK